MGCGIIHLPADTTGKVTKRLSEARAATTVGHLVLANLLGVYRHLLVSASPQPSEAGGSKRGNEPTERPGRGPTTSEAGAGTQAGWLLTSAQQRPPT